MNFFILSLLMFHLISLIIILNIEGGEPATALNSPISGGCKISVKIISMGHTNFLIKLDPRPRVFPKSSQRLSTNTLNINYKTQIAPNKIITHMLNSTLMWMWSMLIFYYRFSADQKLI